MKPTCPIYNLHSLQGHLTGIHFLILSWNWTKDGNDFSSSGTIFQILGAKLEIVSVPNLTVLTLGYLSETPLLRLWLFSDNSKILLIKLGEKPFKYLKISVARRCKFIWWIVTWLSFLSISSKVKLQSEYVILRAHSWILFILLLSVREWNIHIKEQYWNWDIINALKRMRRFSWDK